MIVTFKTIPSSLTNGLDSASHSVDFYILKLFQDSAYSIEDPLTTSIDLLNPQIIMTNFAPSNLDWDWLELDNSGLTFSFACEVSSF
jgi:hypothetical protein